MPAPTPAHLEPDAYMEAFMNGFEFVLLAIRGRLAEGDLPADERARLEVFLADYSRIAKAYRERKDAREDTLVFRGPVVADVALLTKN